MSDPYEVLGVPPTATLDEIKRRYRQLAARYHPDHGAESWIFKQIRAAYEQLCRDLDPDRQSTGDDTFPATPLASESSGSPAGASAGSEPETPAPVRQQSSPLHWRHVAGGVLWYWLCLALHHWYQIPWWVFFIGSICCLATVAGCMFWLGACLDPWSPQPSAENRGWLAYASLSLGLVGLASWMVPLYGWPVAIAGYLCGYFSHTTAGRHLALIGMGLAIYSFVLTSGTFCYVANSASP